MARRINADLLFVGSIPLASTEEVFTTCARTFGDAVAMIPDGELGERASWVGYEATRVWYPHPDVESRGVPLGPEGEPIPFPTHLFNTPIARLRPGVERMRVDLPRAGDAIGSYETFQRLRAEGMIPPGIRFQVCLPATASAFGWLFRDAYAHDYPILERAYEEAMARDLQKLFAAVPAADLAIQLDTCFEVLDLERLFQWTPAEGAWERFIGPFRRLSAMVPAEVPLGVHLCYGTWGGWPMREANDLALAVRMANAAITEASRPVDWLHVAGPRLNRSDDESFFRPLRDLRLGDTRLFLGLIQGQDGIEGFKLRAATARRHLADFGVSATCGFGREDPEGMARMLRIHRRCVEELRAMRG